MNREDFIYTDEAAVLVSPQDVCLIHQIIAPKVVTPENIEEYKVTTKNPSLEIGSFVGVKEDVIKVYMTLGHAIRLKDALVKALDDASKKS